MNLDKFKFYLASLYRIESHVDQAGDLESETPEMAKGVNQRDYEEPFYIFDLASKNIIVVTWAARCGASRAPYQVGLTCAGDSKVFSSEASVRTLMLVIFLQAYRKKASMQVDFCGPKNDEPASVSTGFELVMPEEIKEYAQYYGIVFSKSNQILDEEGREFFIRITFTANERMQIRLAGLDPLVVAFVMNRGTWTHNELYSILNYCAYPQIPLSRIINSSFGIVYCIVQETLRRAYLAERFIDYAMIAMNETDSESELLKFSWVSQSVIRVTSLVTFNISAVLGPDLHVVAKVPFDVGLVPTNYSQINFLDDVDCLCVTQDCEKLLSIKGLKSGINKTTLMVGLTINAIDLANLKKMSRVSNLSLEMENMANG
jgi:hypothetical protein